MEWMNFPKKADHTNQPNRQVLLGGRGWLLKLLDSEVRGFNNFASQMYTNHIVFQHTKISIPRLLIYGTF